MPTNRSHPIGGSITRQPSGKTPLRIRRYVQTRCNALQCTATHCNTLQRTAPHRTALQRNATRCNKLQDTAAHSITLHHAAWNKMVSVNTLSHTAA